MNHREKIDYLVSDLCNRGLKKPWAAPVFDRLIWRFGVETSPPLFQGFFFRFFLVSILHWTALGIALVICILLMGAETVSETYVGFLALVAVVNPVFLSLVFVVKARALNLPPWAQYPNA